MTPPELVNRHRVALDLDGVVYEGRRSLPGAAEAVRDLRAAGFRITFITNNSGATRSDIAHKLTSFDIQCGIDDVISSGRAAALWASARLPSAARVLVLGTAGLKQECANLGLSPVDDPTDVEAVIVGLHPQFSYSDLANATEAVLGGSLLVGCNRDASFPAEGGRVMPGCGPLLAAVELASGRVADIVVGKPAPTMLTELMDDLVTEARDWFVVGDSDVSDMELARRVGVPGILVGRRSARYPNLIDFTNDAIIAHDTTGTTRRSACL